MHKKHKPRTKCNIKCTLEKLGVTKGMAQTWGLEQWTNMDYFLISEPCTLSSMWSIIRALERLCVDFFSGKIVITSA